MLDEQVLRRPAFAGGARIRLADGQKWSLRDNPPFRDDEEHIALLRAIAEAEDEPQRDRSELALAIFLLERNYELIPPDFEAILGYAPEDPALREMQQAVHQIATKQCRALRHLPRPGSASPPLLRSTHWSVKSLLSPLSSARAPRSDRPHRGKRPRL